MGSPGLRARSERLAAARNRADVAVEFAARLHGSPVARIGCIGPGLCTSRTIRPHELRRPSTKIAGSEAKCRIETR